MLASPLCPRTAWKALFGQMPIEGVEQFLDDARLDQSLARTPDGGGVRGFAAVFPPEEAGEGVAVIADVFGVVFGQVVESLPEEAFEHEQGFAGLAPSGRFSVFFESGLDGGQEELPLDEVVQTCQGIAFFVASFEDALLVEDS